MRKLRFIFIFLPLILSFSFGRENTIFHKLNGDVISYQAMLRDSEKTVFFFWTSWCYFCRRELKKMNEGLFDGVKGIQIYYINLGENNRFVEYTAKNLKINDTITANIILDEESWFTDEFDLIGVPTAILFKKGEKVYQTNYLTKEVIKKYFGNE